VTVFSITTHLTTIVMLLVWRKKFIFILLFYVVFSSIELIYLSSILTKFVQGGYLPFCFSLVLMALMITWHYVQVMKYWYELDHIVLADEVTTLLEKNEVRRIPGVGLLYSDLVQGIPPVFPRLVQRIPCALGLPVHVDQALAYPTCGSRGAVPLPAGRAKGAPNVSVCGKVWVQ